MKNIYLDNMGNIATITQKKIIPYNGAKQKQTAYILKCQSLYDNKFTYHLTVHETLEEAEKTLSRFSLGTFKRV